MEQVITVFGATGKVGTHFIEKAIKLNLKIRVVVRNKDKFKYAEASNIEVFEGDATKAEDVHKALDNTSIVVSCLGAVKGILMMEKAYNNIMNAAAELEEKPRCILISSIGCAGTSWLIKWMLIMIGGKAGFEDYESADKRVREDTTVPFVLVRPYALNDKEGSGKYYATKKQNGTFLKPISRTDVAQFMIDTLNDEQWDGQPGVLLGGSK